MAFPKYSGEPTGAGFLTDVKAAETAGTGWGGTGMGGGAWDTSVCQTASHCRGGLGGAGDLESVR